MCTVVLFSLTLFFLPLSAADDDIPLPTIHQKIPGPVLINSGSGRGVAAAAAVTSAVADITSILMEKKLRAAQEQYKKSVTKKKRGKSFERHSKNFFRLRVFHRGLNWVNGLMASGFDTVGWHTHRSRTGGAEKVTSALGHLTGAWTRSQAPSARFVPFRVVAAMLTLLWRLIIVIDSDSMSSRNRNNLIATTRAFEAASVWAGVQAKNSHDYGGLATSILSRVATAYMPFIPDNSIKQLDPTMTIRHAHRTPEIQQMQHDLTSLDEARGLHMQLVALDSNLPFRAMLIEQTLEKGDDGDVIKHAEFGQLNVDPLGVQLKEFNQEYQKRQEAFEELRGMLRGNVKEAYKEDAQLWQYVNTPINPEIDAMAEKSQEIMDTVNDNRKKVFDAMEDDKFEEAIEAYNAMIAYGRKIVGQIQPKGGGSTAGARSVWRYVSSTITGRLEAINIKIISRMATPEEIDEGQSLVKLVEDKVGDNDHKNGQLEFEVTQFKDWRKRRVI